VISCRPRFTTTAHSMPSLAISEAILADTPNAHSKCLVHTSSSLIRCELHVLMQARMRSTISCQHRVKSAFIVTTETGAFLTSRNAPAREGWTSMKKVAYPDEQEA
jgi:hypothetical protein